MKSVASFCFAAVLFCGALMLAALETSQGGNILFYRGQGTAKVVGADADGENARLTWRASGNRQLVLTPRDGEVFNLTTGHTFSLMICSGRPTPADFKVEFIDASGGKTVKNAKLDIDGWRRLVFAVGGLNKKIDGSRLVKVVISAAEPGVKSPVYQVDDIRISPGKIGYEIPDIPPVTSGTYFPEYTRDTEKKRCLDDPQYRVKIAEIEKLRQRFAADFKTLVKGRVPSASESEKAKALWDMVRPDGSITDRTREIIAEFERSTRSHRAEHEGFSRQTVPRISRMIMLWRIGAVEHTPENRLKLIRAFNCYASNELDRRGEHGRWVTSSFLWPSCAAAMYFTFFEEMDAVERGFVSDPDLVLLNRQTKTLACYGYQFPDNGIPGAVLTTEQFRHSGAWIGGNFGYRPLFETALICRNPLMLEVVTEVSNRALDVTSYNTRKTAFWTEGITADKAAWGHGTQNYAFGYPMSGIMAALKTFVNCRDSLWSKKLEPERLRCVIEYVRATQWYCYGIGNRGVTLMLTGRYGMKYSKTDGFQSWKPMSVICRLLLDLIPDGAKKDRDDVQHCLDVYAGKQPEPVGSRYFWNNDDMVFRRADFYIGVNMFCRRTLTCESVPLASSMTDFLADGSTFIMASPDTYTVAKGFWKPVAVPGVTARQVEYEHKGILWRNYSGLYNFAGGVTDAGHGVCGFIYAKAKCRTAPDPKLYGVVARKSYFFFEDEMVCLGAGIDNRTAEVPGTIATTIDQTERRGAVEYLSDAGKSVIENQGDFAVEGKAPFMVAAGGVGYWVLEGGDVKLSCEVRPERWLEFDRNANAKTLDRPKQADILMLQIDHGQNVRGGKYAYAVKMRTPDLAALQAYAKSNPVRILANTPQLQAVRHEKLKITGTVCYNSDVAFDDGVYRWSVSSPAVVMLRYLPDGSVAATVSDPLQNPNRKNIVLTRERLDGGDRRSFTVALPGGVDCGKAATAVLR